MIGHAIRSIGLVMGALAAAALATPALAADAATTAEQQCAQCHGKNGVSTEPSIPIIVISGRPIAF